MPSVYPHNPFETCIVTSLCITISSCITLSNSSILQCIREPARLCVLLFRILPSYNAFVNRHVFAYFSFEFFHLTMHSWTGTSLRIILSNSSILQCTHGPARLCVLFFRIQFFHLTMHSCTGKSLCMATSIRARTISETSAYLSTRCWGSERSFSLSMT
jgi:hypothetical protein